MAEAEYKISRTEKIVIGQGLPSAFTQVLVTYEAPRLPPFTVFLKEADYSDANVKGLILKSIAERRALRV